MLSFSGSLKVFVAVEPCDMRRSFDGLHNAVTSLLGEDPKSGAVFAFTNKRRKHLSFNIPIRHSDHRIPVASVAWAATARGPTKGAERHRGY